MPRGDPFRIGRHNRGSQAMYPHTKRVDLTASSRAHRPKSRA